MYVTTDRALSAGTAAELADRTEVIDALYRFGLGQDLRDAELFGSAFAADAELDFRPAAKQIGIDSAVMTGRDTIVSTILGLFAGRVDTTHVVTNPRVELTGDTARLTAIVEARHLLSADHGTYALLTNLYDVDLVRDGDCWVVRRMVIDNVWFTGRPDKIFVPLTR
jgi:hypothetical protein